MPSPELNPDWVLSSSSPNNKGQLLPHNDELMIVASRLWPRVQAHARRELANKNSDDTVAFAAEVWEGVLRSVSKTLQRRNGRGSGIVDLESGVASLEFCDQPVDFLLEYFGIVTCDYLISAAPHQGIPIRPVHRGIEMLGFHQPADLVKDLRAFV